MEWYPVQSAAVKATASPAPDPTHATVSNRPLSERYAGFTGLKYVNPEYPLIQSRGISIETARAFGIGYFPGRGSMAGRIVFELRPHGELIGYAGRATRPDQEPKWLLAKGVVKDFVYCLERCDPKLPLVLGESFWLPAFMHEKGAQAAALMHCEITDGQERCLQPFDVIQLALDADAKGREAAEKIASRLRRNHTVKVAFLRE
jgi:hypothetical protein